MKKVNVCVGGFLLVTTSFFGTVRAFTLHESIMNERALGQAQAEALLTFRIEEVVERPSPSDCAADPKMMSDERKLDPQLPGCDRRNNRAPLNPKGIRAI
jgi:hypothetical protein